MLYNLKIIGKMLVSGQLRDVEFNQPSLPLKLIIQSRP